MKYLKNRKDSEDAVMDVFEKILEEIKRHEVKNFKAWIHTVTKNHCLMKLRKSQRILKNEKEYEKEHSESMEFGEQMHLLEEEVDEDQIRLIEQGLETLKEEQKKCLELFYLEDKTYTEVSRLTGYAMKEVKSYIQNGKRNLRIYIESTKSGQE